MRKPIIEFIIGNLLLVLAVWFHTPDLHRTRANGIKINVFSVRRVFRTIIQALDIGQPDFLSASRWYFIHIKFSVAFTTEYKEIAIRRPSMQIGRPFWCNLFWDATGCGYSVNNRTSQRFHATA